MKYKDIIGYSKPKKKIITEQKEVKPKKNMVIENIKNEFNMKKTIGVINKEKLNESVESQVKGLWKYTVLPALAEDLTFGDKKNAIKALKTLKKLVSQLKVDDFWIGE